MVPSCADGKTMKKKKKRAANFPSCALLSSEKVLNERRREKEVGLQMTRRADSEAEGERERERRSKAITSNPSPTAKFLLQAERSSSTSDRILTEDNAHQ